jgi:hypothetical protein
MATKKKKPKAVDSLKTKPRLARVAKRPVRTKPRRTGSQVVRAKASSRLKPLDESGFGMLSYLAGVDVVKDIRTMRDEWE